jgi:hypothetical protein
MLGQTLPVDYGITPGLDQLTYRCLAMIGQA